MTRLLRTKVAYNRRLLLIYLIQKGVNTIPKLVAETGYPKRTIVQAIDTLSDHNVSIGRVGTNRTGYYIIDDFGELDFKLISLHIKTIRSISDSDVS
ncbi:helix-turn-helix domain-containing protein [Vibrio anguillarum]|uniref:Helix-turn-helix type 11 domain-containing protein n=1 Tax=Vibrio anguillarum TaxID=55601 RepID=A0AAW4BI15_VIBAN|nr:helix-turn-helix domain-containing protein [Vibrio anguillarum]MBF4374406.1 hypothetical protein [Vibrio anguillarum]MBF4437797.1 hypothetical protein [Vibrio anguillarum]